MKTSIDERYEKEEKKNRRIGLAGAFGSVGLILAILISFGLYYQVPPPEEMGVSLMLGTPDGGMMLEFAQLPPSEESSTNNPDESLTQDIEPAPTVQDNPTKPNPVTSNTEQNDQPNPKPTRVFQNRPPGGGEDEGEEEGNKGNPDGGKHGNIIGGGDGEHGIGEGGRKATRQPIAEAKCTQKGQIQVKITVDARGKVTQASFVAAGSTTTNSVCVGEAVNLAKQWEFESAPAGTKNVYGIITIILQ